MKKLVARDPHNYILVYQYNSWAKNVLLKNDNFGAISRLKLGRLLTGQAVHRGKAESAPARPD